MMIEVMEPAAIEAPHTHARRYAKACDACYVKKVKCDAAGSTCQLCRRTGQSCVFTRAEKGQRKRTRKVNGFSALEDRLKAMENLLKQSQRAPELGDDQILVQASDSSQAGSNESPTFTIDTASPESRRPFEFAPQDQAIQLAQGYLACCNTMMPTFNTGKMLRRMQREWPPDKDADLTWWTTMAIALSFAHRLRAMSDNSGAEYDNREASKYLSEVLDVAPRLAFAKPSVDTAEVLLALTAVMRGSATPETARMFTACAIHVLQELDAHNINSEVYASLTNSQASDLARAWWVAYIHDKNIAILGGKPPIAHEQDVNRPPPQWADVEGFGFVRSLDGSAEANFQVISHRLAVISSQVYTRTMSPNAEVTPAGMTAAQTALNPLLEGWKARLPFVFKPEALVGRWPKHCVIFLAMLHFQYFQTLLQLNRELSTDPLKVLVVNGGLDLVNQLKAHPFSLSPAVVEAARDGLRLASLTPKGTLQHVWLFFDYSICASLSLLVNAIVRPLDPRLSEDIKQVNEWLQIVDALASTSERPDLLQKRQFLLDMREWALSRIRAALAEREATAAAEAAAAAATVVQPHGMFDNFFAPDECKWSDVGDIPRPDIFPLDHWDWTQQHNFMWM